ncbi:hypothetical protein QF025_006579 [Paraburkholderia graminis]|uniref:Uncharacterized protein n=1 Tax=Paraburkholderia graminis TaxID=60548 RepID=A0ABD5CR92_9BURK|nr:hypothetical protein [Paraburkholderia graminis]
MRRDALPGIERGAAILYAQHSGLPAALLPGTEAGAMVSSLLLIVGLATSSSVLAH